MTIQKFNVNNKVRYTKEGRGGVMAEEVAFSFNHLCHCSDNGHPFQVSTFLTNSMDGVLEGILEVSF